MNKMANPGDKSIISNQFIQSIGSNCSTTGDVRYNHQDSSSGAIKKKVEFQRADKNHNHFIEGGGHSNGKQVDRDGGFSYKYLDSMLKLDEEEFSLRITENMCRLNNCVDEVDSCDDAYVVLIRVLKKIFDSRFSDLQRGILQCISNEHFINNLQKYLGYLPMHDEDQKLQNELFWENTDTFWIDLIEGSQRALELFPDSALKLSQKVVLALEVCLPTFEHHQNKLVPDEIKMKLNKLTEILKATKLQFGMDDIILKPDVEEPPDDFRAISVYPAANEIFGERRFVRPNIIDGPYKNVDHYLDVQYRLLREDFVNPLRCGVRSIRCGNQIRHENVEVYQKIRFLHQEAVNEHYCIRLRYNFTRKTLNLNRGKSEKFMFGSLLCFTRDNFVTSKVARIVKSDFRDLRKGELVVEFDKPQPDLSFDHDYLMVECSVYFEPYFHVLRGLKSIYEEDLAMMKYIVDVQPVRVLPKYLNSNEIYKVDGKEFNISDLSSTTDNLYGFNDSQMKAFKAALTSEFTIIQGPPGTGKTFLALKIAKTLIDNYNSWWNSTPMLVICFTNHALDQFLEGLLGMTEKIVRIGGQSKNESLLNVNLNVLRKQRKFMRRLKKCSTADYNWDELQSSKFMMKNSLKDVRNVRAEIEEIEKYRGIVSSRCFRHTVFGPDKTFFPTLDGENLAAWLLEGYQKPESRRGTNGKIDVTMNENPESLKSSSSCIQYSDSTFIITLEDIQGKISKLKHNLFMLKNELKLTEWNIFFGGYPFDEIDSIQKSILALKQQYEYLERRLVEVKLSLKNQLLPIDFDTSDLASLSHDDRWILYASWLRMYKQHLQERATISMERFQRIYKQYEEERDYDDVTLLRGKLVVGMTTTSAARLRPVLKRLKCPIIIVEEAAEVLEAHIVAALTEYCRHLILIGDHKQLKPSSADYSITRDYNLGVSLFERMVNNGIECHTLNVQHRMRPEFSRLIRPVIYPDLEDHESVLNRPPITGINSCIRFIDHTHLEDNCANAQTKKNSHEVKLALALVRHLILNGYKPEQVTILSAYLGQVTEMLKERDKYERDVRGVRIAALDNYQGEQSDIIILSLVRSNTAGRIGFLATENRVCVALSRARHGLYIIGNMGLLSSKSKLWDQIRNTLEAQNAIGPDLTLRCEIHRKTTVIRKGGDFQRVARGGCTQMCRAELACGHLCDSQCHVVDREHEKYQCLQPCLRKLCENNANHICQKMCYEICGPCTHKVLRKLDCGHDVWLGCYIDVHNYNCIELVAMKLPCGHVTDKACHVDASTLECPMPCLSIISPCGHYCIRSCHVDDDPEHIEYKCIRKCTRPRVGCTMLPDSTAHLCPKLCYEDCALCDVLVAKQRSVCSHINEVTCNSDVDSLKCIKPCTMQLSCGHRCKKKCSEPCDPSSCTVRVKKILQKCGHKIATLCNREPNPNNCNKRCPLKLVCGHRCTRKCNQICTPCCEVLVNIQGLTI